MPLRTWSKLRVLEGNKKKKDFDTLSHEKEKERRFEMKRDKKFLPKLVNTMDHMKTGVTTMLVAGAAGSGILVPNVHASSMASNGTDNAQSIVKTVADAIAGVLPFIGVFFLLAGAVKTINGFRNDNNPEAIASGAKDLVIGAVLIAFRAFLWNPIKGAIGLD
jgi:hypothetical protein